MWDICRKAARGKLELQGDGSQSRDFIHASDVAEAVWTLINTASEWPTIINLAQGVEVSVAEVAAWICEELHHGLEARYDGIVPPGTPSRWQADVGLMKSLGWSPGVTPEKGIRDFARWAAGELKR